MKPDFILSAKELSIGYRLGWRGEKTVHRDLNFQLKPGELTCLLGPNGAGKSTLLRTISGVQKPLSGILEMEGRRLSDYCEKEISCKIGLVLTDKTMAGGLTVFELVSLGRHPHTGFFGRLKAEDYEAVGKALAAVGITDKAGNYVAELSDGERQKVMIARVLAQECPVLLLDEPTAFLDVVSRIEIMSLLHDLAVKQGKTILLSTHDLEQALLLGDRLWLLAQDKGLRCGITEELVFSGDIDRYFSRDAIVFDGKNGSFRPSVPGIKVGVEAEGDLSFWTQNMLLRHGFCPATPGERTVWRLQVVSPGEFRIIFPDHNVIVLHSFDELSAYLKGNSSLG